jgi:biopolymer transport protein ExbD
MQSRPNLLTREINLGPLVDLSLVLLILLVVVIPMLRHDPLPTSKRPAAAQGLVDHLAVAMAADGAVFIEQRQVGRDELPELLFALHIAAPNRPVLVKGDRRLRYGQVRQLMGEIYRAGFQRVALTMEARPDPKVLTPAAPAKRSPAASRPTDRLRSAPASG